MDYLTLAKEMIEVLRKHKEEIDRIFESQNQKSTVFSENGIDVFVFHDKAIAEVRDWLYTATLTYYPSFPYLEFAVESVSPNGESYHELLLDWDGNEVLKREPRR